MAFAVVFAAEFGDLTQILTVSLAARYGDPLAVGIGSVLALWVAAGGAIIGGRSLLKIIPMAWLARGAALIMLVLAGFSIVTAVSLPSFRAGPFSGGSGRASLDMRAPDLGRWEPSGRPRS